MSTLLNNKVSESGLISIDLASFMPTSEIILFDIKPYLFMELILKEKDFRNSLATIDWSAYNNKIVGIYCSADAIIPMWANMLIVASLQSNARAVYFGNEEKVREQIILSNINLVDPIEFIDQRVVIKGCGETPISEGAYIAITQKLCPVVKSIMYGEPCSTVPVFKRKAQ